jgi:hypothetical protein
MYKSQPAFALRALLRAQTITSTRRAAVAALSTCARACVDITLLPCAHAHQHVYCVVPVPRGLCLDAHYVRALCSHAYHLLQQLRPGVGCRAVVGSMPGGSKLPHAQTRFGGVHESRQLLSVHHPPRAPALVHCVIWHLYVCRLRFRRHLFRIGHSLPDCQSRRRKEQQQHPACCKLGLHMAQRSSLWHGAGGRTRPPTSEYGS